MYQSTLLIGQEILRLLSNDARFVNKGLREILGELLRDPDLWVKVRLLKSEKYTKTYQSEGLNLVALKFYPVPEDWCLLSAISNGSGFSRCYIFVYLLEYLLGIRKIDEVTTRKNNQINKSKTVLSKVKISRSRHYLLRCINPEQKNPRITPIVNKIQLNQKRLRFMFNKKA